MVPARAAMAHRLTRRRPRPNDGSDMESSSESDGYTDAERICVELRDLQVLLTFIFFVDNNCAHMFFCVLYATWYV